MWAIVIEHIFLETLLDVFYFPIWWYSRGLLHATGWCFDLLKSGNRTLAPVLWLRNLFVPMYGQYDWEGRIISFFMRLAQTLARGVALVFWLAWCIVLFIVWLALPVVVGYGLIKH